jgi:hypothetical protein
MKFYFYFCVIIFHSLSCLGADDEYFNDEYYPDYFSNNTSDCRPKKSNSNPDLPRDLKLIKTGFEKFAHYRFFTNYPYSQSENLTTDQQNRIIENNVSIEVQNILWYVKNYLDKMDSDAQIFNGIHFSKIIEQSLERLLSLLPMFTESSIEDAESTQKDESPHLTTNEEKFLKLNILLDRYFRSQLLAFNYALLLPISSQNIDRYNNTGSAIKLKFFRLIDNKLKVDDLKSWSRKKQLFFVLDQAIRHLSNPLSSGDIPELKLRGLNYKINQDYLLDYYQEACHFLISSYSQTFEKVKTFIDLKDLSFTYLAEFLGLYSDYSKIFPDLIKDEETNKSLLSQLKQQLNKFYEFHMNIANQYFRNEALKCTNLEKLSNLLKHYILETQKFNAKFTTSYKELFNDDLNPRFQEAIMSYFDDTLYCLEHHFEANRFTISKTLTSLGWRQSQTKDFLIQLEALYKTAFPFLFDENTKAGKIYMGKVMALIDKINMQEQESLNKTMETIESVKGFFSPTKWLSKDTSK